MAGRPRTMVKGVRRLLEQHEKLTEELRNLGKHHMPAKGERWDFDLPGGEADPIPPLWRIAVFKASCVNDYIDDLLCFLELKVEEAEQSATATADEADGANNRDAEDDAETEPGDDNVPADAEQSAGDVPESAAS